MTRLFFVGGAYFLYSVAPSVSASYKFATSLIIVVRFFNKHIPEYEDTVKQRIYDLTESLLVSSRFEDGKDISEFVSLESVNVVLACKEMGPNYLLPPETIEVLFFRDRKLSYFGIVSCLFYIGSEPMYQGVFKKLLSALQKRFKSLTNVAEDAELAALCVDAICCPYINQKTRKAWLKRLYQSLQLQQPTAADTSIFFQNVGQRNWFVNWSEADLLNCLQRKELKRASIRVVESVRFEGHENLSCAAAIGRGALLCSRASRAQCAQSCRRTYEQRA